MSTVQEIITFADRKYPNSETTANKILDLDDIHKEIFVRINRLSGNHKSGPDATEANQLSYSLPSDCLIDNIIKIQVSNDAGTEWYDFEFAGLHQDVSYGRYWGKVDETHYALVENGLPITTTDRGIRIYYYKSPATLSITTNVPELDPLYHNLLKYALIQALASQGHSPDSEIADYWQSKFDEFMKEIEGSLGDKYTSEPTQTCELSDGW